MGLAGPKRKQRLIGAASSRNANWVEDATLPGQRLLSQMGWQEGQGLGTSSTGRSQAVKAMFKMDNKGIGSHRAEKEAREKGLPGPGMDRWIGGGGELGGLFDRLNAGASTSASPVPEETVTIEPSSSKAKKEGKDKKRKRESSKAAASSTSSSSSSDDEEEKPKKSKKSRSSTDDEERKAKKERKRAEKEEKRRRKEEKKKKAKARDEEEEEAVVAAAAPMVIRNASRAKYLRAKRQLRGDLVSMNEILGISASNSPAASPSPAPLASTAGEVEAAEAEASAIVAAAEEAAAKKQKKEDKAIAKEEKKAAKKAAKEEAKKQEIKAEAAAEEAAKPSPPSLNTVSTLSVHEYLTRRLMLRKAQVARARKADQEAVWGRLSGGQAGGAGIMVE